MTNNDSQVKTGWICIATSGPTQDGREVSAECLRQLAETYDPHFYSANLWPEGNRTRPLGHVTAVKVQEEGGQLKLFATISPTLELIDLNLSGTYGFCAIEPYENFAKTGKWYLGGVTVTDSPTLTGLTRMQFSVKPPAQRQPAPTGKPTPAKPASLPTFKQADDMARALELLDRRIDALSKVLEGLAHERGLSTPPLYHLT